MFDFSMAATANSISFIEYLKCFLPMTGLRAFPVKQNYSMDFCLTGLPYLKKQMG